MRLFSNVYYTCSDFFCTLDHYGISDPDDIIAGIADSSCFELPEEHLYKGYDYHVLLMVFSAIKLLNFGTLPFEKMLEDETFLPELYSEHLIATIYIMLAEFFCSGGTEFCTGSKCMCALICLLICLNMPLLLFFHLQAGVSW